MPPPAVPRLVYRAKRSVTVYTPEFAGSKAGALTANSTARATRSICFCIAQALAGGTIAAGSPPERTMPHMLKRKDYERQLDSLHLELIELLV